MDWKKLRRRPLTVLAMVAATWMFASMLLFPSASAATGDVEWYNLWGLGLVGLGLIVTGGLVLWMFFSDKYKKTLATLVVGALIFTGIAAIVTYSSPATQSFVPSLKTEATFSDSDAEITVDNTLKEIRWAIQYNTTSNAFVSNTGTGTVNCSMSYVSGPEGDALLTIGAVPSVAISGASSEEIVDMHDASDYAVYWTKLSSGETYQIHDYGSIKLNMEEGVDRWASCNITLNADAFAAKTSANENEMWTWYLSIGSESWKMIFILDDVIT